MTMTQRGALSEADRADVLLAKTEYEDAFAAYREATSEAVDKSSYREVARLTGLSTNTLLRWKREAGK